ncbi:hypothetical protein [Actinobacillus porcinus]|uniref:hypothetical protein n=1 Tax=Actinobacillus porcinus TaxID=51048 RepID=UPI002A915E20|nr:hypothetical protein [Actinobacillus porcinus]MDY6216853.1 hypothetical protein [Actinobacillus porcinus]
MNFYSFAVIGVFIFLCAMSFFAFIFKKKKNSKLYLFFASCVVGSISSLDFTNTCLMILNIINPIITENTNFFDIYSFFKGIIVTLLMYFASSNIPENNENTKAKDIEDPNNSKEEKNTKSTPLLGNNNDESKQISANFFARLNPFNRFAKKSNKSKR